MEFREGAFDFQTSQQNQEAYSKRNIAKYLKKAIEQYLPTVKLQDLEQPERASVRGKGEIHE